MPSATHRTSRPPSDPVRARRQRRAGAIAIAGALLVPLGGAAAHADDPELAPSTSEAPTNLALAGTATASSVELGWEEFAPEHVNDDDPSTRWSAARQDDEWVQIELAEPAEVDHVVLHWAGPRNCAREFVLQTSVDGETWTDVAEHSSSICPPRTDEVDVGAEEPVSLVRMQGRDRWARPGYSLTEFAIYDEPPAPPEPTLGLVPKPVSVDELDGEPFELQPGARIMAIGDGAQAPADYLADVLRPSTGYQLPVVSSAPASIPNRPRGSSPRPIIIEVGPGNAPDGHTDEGYTLDVDSNGIHVAADTPNGALNGVQTLRQLFGQWIASDSVVEADWTVPAVSITDYPRFEHRGMMLDVARSFYPMDELKAYIDSAAQFKINRLHLHLSDDQGWRIAIDNPENNPSGIDYGLLTEVSGETATWYRPNGEMLGTELGVTGYYTKDDYAEIIRYAAENGMTVIPEIDVPGHTTAALHAIPQLNTSGSRPQPLPGEDTAPANTAFSGGSSTLDAHSDVTYEFVEHVLTEIAAMTPGDYLHIGGDEALVTSHEDYVTMVDRFNEIVADLDKTVVGWNEYASTDLPDGDAVVQYWDGGDAATADAVAEKDAQVVMSPNDRTYVPQKQDARQPLGATRVCGGPCDLHRHYSWDPGAYIDGVDESSVLGVESALWSWFIRRVDQAEYYSYPRLVATAEVGWTPQDQRDYADFTHRLSAVGGQMTLEGTNFFPTWDVPWRIETLGTADVTDEDTVETAWTVTAPGFGSHDLEATLRWSDGVEETVSLTTDREGSIPGMVINDAFTGSSQRSFDRAGTYAATLSVKAPGRAPVESTVTTTVPSPGDGE